jgi:MGT family glycosyltransferase
VTFGTVAAQRDDVFPVLYRSTIDALAPLPVRVLVTIGRDRDPRDLGPVPANVHVERWVPQASVMPHARAMVSHGGSGTLRAGLAAGIPQVVLPLFADQPDNADRVDALGAGIAPGPDGVAEAVRAVLTDARYAARAADVAADIEALPDVDVAVSRLREHAG